MKFYLSFAIFFIFTSNAPANEFDPRNCSTIQDVTVDLKPTFNDGSISLNNSSTHITISNHSYRVNNQTVGLNDYKGYYLLMRDFFDNASLFATYMGASHTDKEGYQTMMKKHEREAFLNLEVNEFYEKITTMCRVILALHEANRLAKKNDQNFVAGIKISLKNE